MRSGADLCPGTQSLITCKYCTSEKVAHTVKAMRLDTMAACRKELSTQVSFLARLASDMACWMDTLTACRMEASRGVSQATGGPVSSAASVLQPLSALISSLDEQWLAASQTRQASMRGLGPGEGASRRHRKLPRQDQACV